MALGMTLFFVGEQASSASAPDPLRGNVIAATSGLTWALTMIAMRSASRDPARTVGPMLIMGNALACIGCLPLALPVQGTTAVDWAVIAYLGVVQIGLAYVLVSAGMRHVTALEGVLLLLVEPALNPVWAALVQGERPGPWSLVGGATILAATVGKTIADSGRA